METQKLQVWQTITDSIRYGLKNVASLLLLVVLYLLTFWIPYLNVGTTIGVCKAVIKMGRGEVINPLSIFDGENFRNMSEYFLLSGLTVIGTLAAAAFMLFPAFVIGIAWSFAPYFLLDKGYSPLKCLKVSYKVTYGEKWRIFFTYFIVSFAYSVIISLLGSIPHIGWLLSLVFALAFVAVFCAICGVMYAHFADKAESCCCEACDCGSPAPSVPAAPVAPAVSESTIVPPAAPAETPEEKTSADADSECGEA